MKSKTLLAAATLFFCLSNAAGAEPAATATREANYNDWGWDEVLVLDNGLIHLSVVPAAGARVLEYNLDGHPSLHITEDELGKVYEPSDEVKGGEDWRNYGVFHTGTAHAVLLDAGGTILSSTQEVPVFPKATLRFREYFGSFPLTATQIELRLNNWAGKSIGLLDAVTLP